MPAPSQDSHQEGWREDQDMLRVLPRQQTLTLPSMDTGFPEDLRHEGHRAIQAAWDRKKNETLNEGSGNNTCHVGTDLVPGQVDPTL